MKKFVSNLFVFTFIILTYSSLAWSAGIYVSPSGSSTSNGKFAHTPTTLDNAILNISQPGDVIYLNRGVYTINSTLTLPHPLDFASNPNQIVRAQIECLTGGDCFEYVSNSTSPANFSFRNLVFRSNGGDTAILLDRHIETTLTIDNCDFSDFNYGIALNGTSATSYDRFDLVVRDSYFENSLGSAIVWYVESRSSNPPAFGSVDISRSEFFRNNKVYDNKDSRFTSVSIITSDVSMRLTDSSLVENLAGVIFDGGRNIYVEGNTFDRNLGYAFNAERVDASQDIEVYDNAFIGGYYTPSSTSLVDGGFLIEQSPSFSAPPYVYIQGNDFRGLSSGMTLEIDYRVSTRSYTSTSNYVLIDSNTFVDNGAAALVKDLTDQSYSTKEVRIEKNYFEANAYGLEVQYACFANSRCEERPHHVVRNNLFLNNVEQGLYLYGLRGEVVFNTFSGGKRGLNVGGGTTFLEESLVVNNIFQNSSDIAVFLYNSSSLTEVGYNVYWNNNQDAYFIDPSIQDLRNNWTTNPLLITTSLFEPVFNSPIIDGSYTSIYNSTYPCTECSPLEDFDGDPRVNRAEFGAQECTGSLCQPGQYPEE